VLIAVILVKVSKIVTFQFFGELVTRVDTAEKVVALTFDDGPSKGQTEEILGILRKNDVKATFYLVGKDINANPHQTALIVRDGHEVGNHSYTHQKMIFSRLSFVSEEVENTNQEIRKSGYAAEITFRPPYGRKLFTLPYYLSKKNILSVTWDIEPDSALSKNSMGAIPGIIQGLKSKGYRFVTVSQLLSMRKQ
jgi:peptidoglycan/xylan/chitin deacetylase (PgdA/CDA1 family)